MELKGIKDFLRGDFYVKDLGLWKGNWNLNTVSDYN